MRFSTKGIGWLIFGLLVCASATDPTDFSDAVGTFLIGLVFVAVYLMKQRFAPKGIGWFIAGGIVLAFSAECLAELLLNVLRSYSVDSSEMSDMLIGFIVACVLLFVFYRKNKYGVYETAESIDDVDDGDGFSFPHQEHVFRENVVEETETAVSEKPDDPEADVDTILDIEVTDGD